jgi:biotin operon repressor
MANVTFKTEREFLNAVIKAEVSDAITEFAKGRIAALDKKNEQRKVSKSALAHKAENDNFKSAILAALADGQIHIASELSEILGVSTQKVSALARQLAEDGTIEVDDVPIKGKGKVKGYSIPSDDDIIVDEEEDDTPEEDGAPEEETAE